MKFENYIFDFGKVLVEFEPEYMTKQYITDEADVKMAQEVIFDRLYWDRLDSGDITDGEVINGIKSRLPQRLHNAAVTVYKNWYYHLPCINGMRELLSEIKSRGGKLYLLSNISATFAENCMEVKQLRELFSMFNGIVFSAPIKKVKPNAQIFEHLLRKYNLCSKDCVFIDDNQKNIDGAAKVGIKGYLFCGDAEKLKAQIL